MSCGNVRWDNSYKTCTWENTYKTYKCVPGLQEDSGYGPLHHYIETIVIHHYIETIVITVDWMWQFKGREEIKMIEKSQICLWWLSFNKQRSYWCHFPQAVLRGRFCPFHVQMTDEINRWISSGGRWDQLWGSFRAPANSCSDTPSNAAICPCTPGSATRWPMPCEGSALLQDPVALPCRWAFSFSCTQTRPPRLQPWFGSELGVCGTYSFNDRAMGQGGGWGGGRKRLENCL